MDASKVRSKFIELFSNEPMIARAPGRVNIIGEHTDYNDGFVLPAAVDKEMVFALAPNGLEVVRAHALDLNETEEFPLTLDAPREGWINFIIGVTVELSKKGASLKGYDLVFSSDVPMGAGMSSSAALECALGTGLNTLFNAGLSQKDIALAGQASEHNFVGVKCGIMDQFASTFGKANHVIRLDCRSKEMELVPLKMEGYKLVLCNTKVTHSLASSEYNTRREQCEAGVEILKTKYPEITNLRDCTPEMVKSCQAEMEAKVYDRCLYVVEENDRLMRACDCMAAGDLAGLGKEIYGSHDGLSKLYEVSCPELDFLVDQTREREDVLGARMMGGGFGGCTINLVAADAVDGFIADLTAAYKKELNKDMEAYVVVTGDGARTEAEVEA
ncbi:galactokinase [Persicobacter psychrovividus]|uniref:Galactokinase n=1 Tax=Persicobacter psychrovividus TaxID=387638 RepID=A0ABM7VIW7_9BACT|nr:galactokinase [Persicobacter psychrovividus]